MRFKPHMVPRSILSKSLDPLTICPLQSVKEKRWIRLKSKSRRKRKQTNKPEPEGKTDEAREDWLDWSYFTLLLGLNYFSVSFLCSRFLNSVKLFHALPLFSSRGFVPLPCLLELTVNKTDKAWRMKWKRMRLLLSPILSLFYLLSLTVKDQYSRWMRLNEPIFPELISL